MLRQPLFLTLAGSCALHFAFMGYVLALPPAPKLTPAMASERIAKFVIAKFPAPPKAEPEQAPPPPPKVAQAPARKPPKVTKPKRQQLAKRPHRKLPPPKVEAPKPPAPAPPEPAPASVVVTSKPAPHEAAEIQVAAASAAAEAGPEGPAGAVPVEVAPAPAADGPVASSEYEPGPDLDGLRRGYVGKLNRFFRRIQTYPRRARRAGLEGTVLLEVVLDSQGRIVDIRVARSSGHAILDDAARKAVASLGTVPSPPGELQWRSQAVQIPFHYSLRS